MMEPVSFPGALKLGVAGLAAALLLSVQVKISAQQSNAAPAGASSTASQRQFLDRYCATCHNERLKSGGLSLVQTDVSRPGAQPELWEKVVRKLHTGVMPPPNTPQPSNADRTAMLAWLLFGEAFTASMVLGMVLTAAGVALVVRRPSR